jgi:hypothetical protein
MESRRSKGKSVWMEMLTHTLSQFVDFAYATSLPCTSSITMYPFTHLINHIDFGSNYPAVIFLAPLIYIYSKHA